MSKSQFGITGEKTHMQRHAICQESLCNTVLDWSAGKFCSSSAVFKIGSFLPVDLRKQVSPSYAEEFAFSIKE